MVLADSAYNSILFLKTVKSLKINAVVGVKSDRCLVDGRKIRDLHKGGQQIYLNGLPFPVSAAHYYFKKDNGKYEKRHVICTKQLKASNIVWWGKKRWQIEGFFKTIKHRFSLARFGQATKKGVYRWILLGLIAFVLAVWSYWVNTTTNELNWRIATRSTLEILFPSILLNILLVDIEGLRPIAKQQGIDIKIQRC